MTSRRVQRPRWFSPGLLGLVAMACALVAWALASPVGASPDEDYHLASIWCAQGERDGICESADDPGQRLVPQRLLTSPCYAFKPEVSAECQTTTMKDTELVLTDRGNFDGSYPPVFYFVMSFFVGDEVGDSVVVMRLVNVALALALSTAVWVFTSARLRRALVGAAVVTLVPLGMFLVPSINPSSWAWLSALTFPVALLGYVTTEERRRRWTVGALAAVALGIGAGARADSAMYAALAVGLVVIMTARFTKAHLRRLVYPAILGLVAVALFFTTGQSESVDGSDRPAMSLGAMVRLMADIPSLWTGALGGWGLGWLDTYMPALVWIASWSMFVGVVFAALAGADRRQSFALVLAGGAVWAIPGYMQILSGYPVGAAIQPRYILPLLVILAVVALARVSRPAVRWSGSQWLLVTFALGIANAAALHFNLRRYITGADLPKVDLGDDLEWWWSTLPVGPMVVWAIGALAFAVAVALLTFELRAGEPASPSHEEPQGEATDPVAVTVESPGAAATLTAHA